MNIHLTTVEHHIYEWDPEKLIVSGAPIDEYKREINEIYNALPNYDNVFELAKNIKAIFEQSYDIEYDPNACFKVAEVIWEDVRND